MSPATLVAHRPLGAQAQRALQAMIERNGLSRREAMDLGIANLPARVLDIRRSYGDASVRTDMVSVNGGAEFAVYHFVALGGQVELPL